MPPRYAYWTIIAGGLPTAFRTSEREELLPVFHRLKQKHPDATMKWFARGKLWDSPEEEREANSRRQAEAQRDRPARGRDWRPGGEHRDPRQRFKDAKQARNQEWRRHKFERKQASQPGKPGTGFRDRPDRDSRQEGRRERPRDEFRQGRPTPEGRPGDTRPNRPRSFQRGGFDRNQQRTESRPPNSSRDRRNEARKDEQKPTARSHARHGNAPPWRRESRRPPHRDKKPRR